VPSARRRASGSGDAGRIRNVARRPPQNAGDRRKIVSARVIGDPSLEHSRSRGIRLAFDRLSIDTNPHVDERSSVVAKYGRKAAKKVERAMHERKRGTLKSGRSGKRVTSRKQAIAIGLSEARQEGAKVPRKRGSKKGAAKKSGARKSASRKSSRKSARKT